MSKICPKCNMENINDAMFCDNCGENLKDIEKHSTPDKKEEDAKKSKSWGILHSWWIILTFTLGFLNWLAFFYIGITAKQKKWIFWGLVYLIPTILLFIFSDSPFWDTLLGDAIFILFLIAWIMSIIHAFIVRKEYLVRLEFIQNKKDFELRKRIEKEYN